jgi:membrane protein DedA with SNARE-associated domain
VAEYGLWLVFVNVLLEQLGFPIPAAPTLIVAGALSVRGELRLVDVLVVSVGASVLADSLWYLLGRRLGLGVLKALCRISLSPDSCVRQTSAAFERWGMPSLLVAKFIPGFSTVAPPLAGAISRRPAAFLLYDGGGALLWAGAAVILGRVFHRAIDRGLAFLSDIGARAFLLIAVSLALFVAFKWWQRRRFYRALRMARVSVSDLSALLAGATPPVVIDVRTPSGLLADPRRIPGARNLTFEQVQSRAFDLPAGREIILYCT